MMGLLLNELVIWMYWQTALSYAGEYPPPLAPIAGTVFLLMIPAGLVSLGCSTYFLFREYRLEIRKISSG
ncbi:MAG: hypothetical protein KAR33_08280 [Candidatus Thorarchaeota archaeon]|nr:hypothetical protein [Candidatus Thorarchaeota archaeon]